jgi:DNA-binding YbaB/EbfC family protein
MKSFGDLMKQAQKMQRQMTEAEEKLADTRFESSAGGGMVKAVVDGRGRVKEIKIDPKALEEKDISLLEDLMITAVGEAQRNAEEQMKEMMGKITGGMNLPFMS